jgi:hypothetical protein
VRAHEDADDHGADYFPVAVAMTVIPLVVANVALDPPIVRAGESIVATFTGTNLASDITSTCAFMVRTTMQTK